MLKKYNKVFVTGDLHLGDVSFDHEAKLVEILKNNKFDCLVFGGDTFDLWRERSVDNIVAKYSQLFKVLQSLKTKVVFIRGNHDMEIDSLRRLGFSIKNKFKFVNSYGEKIKVIHGDQFDRYCRQYETILRRAVWVEEKMNSMLRKIDNDYVVRLSSFLGTLDLANIVDNFYGKINAYRNIDKLLFGHIHVPWEGKKGNVDFYNWGGWQNDFGLKPRYLVSEGRDIKTIEIK